MSDQGVCAMVRAMTSNSQCVLQALLVSGNDEQGGITEVTHAALLSLTGRTVADRGRLELLPTETRKLIEKWVELQESKAVAVCFFTVIENGWMCLSFFLFIAGRRTKSYNTLKQSFDEEGMSAGAGTECSEGTEDERNDLNFDFPGPPGTV